jgi:hypothetical protein
MPKKITLLKKSYTTNTLEHLAEDVDVAGTPVFNPLWDNIPFDISGNFPGTINISITWIPPKE